ncbi:hypothetical protein, partial [Pseudomonas sp. 30_B]|uniref:hypothetical protein n=1 Tax=Pseudomonas sp. 30_B TaxID=2813575 RepID=UPI001A9FD9F9
ITASDGTTTGGLSVVRGVERDGGIGGSPEKEASGARRGRRGRGSGTDSADAAARAKRGWRNCSNADAG